MSECESDDEPQLSAQALAALQEFYAEQKAEDERLNEALSHSGNVDNFQPKEDWQLSQFWYDNKTADILAREAIAVAGKNGRIACVSSPTAYKRIMEIKPDSVVAKCLEYDTRFQVFEDDFIFYDFNEPLKLDASLKNSFDLVIADPPYLSEECLLKTAITIKYLAKEKILLCTGAVMADTAKRLLQVQRCKFEPKHTNNLQNEFLCFINYVSDLLN